MVTVPTGSIRPSNRTDSVGNIHTYRAARTWPPALLQHSNLARARTEPRELLARGRLGGYVAGDLIDSGVLSTRPLRLGVLTSSSRLIPRSVSLTLS